MNVYIIVMVLDKNIVKLNTFDGRGAQITVSNSLEVHQRDPYWDGSYFDEEFFASDNQTQWIPTQAKTLLNKVSNPDLDAPWSMNPYQGCEHGCIYCYARITHEYWGYNAGFDFEQKVMYKSNAPELLEKKLKSRIWRGEKITLSGNTDCYQPIEQKLKITRQLLEICLRYKQRVMIITKNALVLRDIDILGPMAKLGLVEVHISITTLNETLRRSLEPRTSSSLKKLRAIQTLARLNIPVHVLLAPIIPGLNSDEIFPICKAVSKAGAVSLQYSLIRLSGTTALLFENWICKKFPLKASRVLHQITETHQGSRNDGCQLPKKHKGVIADLIHQQIEAAKRKYGLCKTTPKIISRKLGFIQSNQLNLF